ncbi:hypothetical protein [Paenibacillus xerothermodurans]|uniref:LSM domain-containing protein n=1 Tax=Paenibacillus xerothermodurans TaxID=1977292 RepID=A0A2W1NC18_PAEXE|nr:hypothetical protein [Paenibacillus xerothermodurans]PZE21200.1 hypothetical protein CBW46_007450 [Paenibacillus xerothermodurans]
MTPIHPISARTCSPHYGKPALVILSDGTELAGTLTGYDKGKIIINGESGAADSSISSTRKKTPKKKKAHVSLSAYETPSLFAPVTPFSRKLSLESSMIARLFVLS